MGKAKTQEKFELEVNEIFGEEYSVIGKYINNRTKIEIKHNICGKIYMSIPKDLLRNKGGCSYCSKGKEKTLEDFLKVLPDDYEIIGEFKGYKKDLLIKHKTCNYVFKMEPSYISRGRRCPKCGGTKKKTNDEFIEHIKSLPEGDEYKFLEEYINDRTKLEVCHLSCNNIYKVVPSHFIQGKRCPFCNNFRHSRGIKLIENFLIENNIKFDFEKKFNNFKSQKKKGQFYRFDFYLPNFNLLIEFDGSQHFNLENNFSKHGNFNLRENDILKNNYSLKENLKLLRISYHNQKNISKILDKIVLKRDERSETIEKFGVFFINDKIINEEFYYNQI